MIDIFGQAVDVFGRRDRQQQRVRDAAKVVAARAGDVAAQQYLVHYYTTQAQATNPYADWWAYADVRQKQADHETELKLATRRHQAAVAKLNAQQLKMEKMK